MFNPDIRYNENISTKENIKAMINWLNFCCTEITTGRMIEAKDKIAETEISMDNLQSVLDDTVNNQADLLMAICEMELGL